jgi:hypothetical protein
MRFVEVKVQAVLISPTPSHGFVPGFALGCVVSHLLAYLHILIHEVPRPSTFHQCLAHTSPTSMRTLYENSISYMYKLLQTLHPGGTMRYNLAGLVRLLTLLISHSLLSSQKLLAVISHNPKSSQVET